MQAHGQDVEFDTPTILNKRLTLKNTSYFSDSDNGVIYSDPNVLASDIIISVNDGVAFDIGKRDADVEF